MGVFDGIQYIELRKNRVNAILKHYGDGWFKGKKVLELGCGYGDIGNMFYLLGADVTITDARKEHILVAHERYPEMKKVICNLNNEWPFKEKFDFIINTGLLYHLNEITFFLKNCFSNCNHMFLESIVADSDDPEFIFFSDEKGEDQSFNEVGSSPSQAMVEWLIKENGFNFTRCFEKSLNYQMHLFDWELKNTKMRCRYISDEFHWLRRAWFCSNE